MFSSSDGNSYVFEKKFVFNVEGKFFREKFWVERLVEKFLIIF